MLKHLGSCTNRAKKWLAQARQQRYWQVLAILILVGAGLRFYKLGQIPAGLTWDEAAIAYNGFGVWDEFRDEWLNLLPLSFKSFGDYKAPLAIYLTGFFVKFFGSEPWVIRLPFALSGVVAIPALAWLTMEICRFFKIPKSIRWNWALIAAGLLALSPWHLHFSRAGFESGLALTLVLIGSATFYRWLHQPNWFWGLGAATFLVASLYTYHSTKVFLPLLGLSWLIWHRQILLSKDFRPKTIGLTIYAALITTPLAFNLLFQSGAARAQQTSLLASDGSLLEKISLFFNNFFAHFDARFLLMGETTTLRHGTGVWGVLLPTVFLIWLVGLITMVLFLWKKQFQENQKKSVPFHVFGAYSLLWIGLGLMAPAIGMEIPHSNRALLALPGFIWLALFGYQTTIEWIKQLTINTKIIGTHGEKDMVLKSIIGFLALGHLLLFVSFWNHYLIVYPTQSGDSFLDGYLVAAERALEFESTVDQIVFSDQYGQPYIFVLLAKRADPFDYAHRGTLNTFLFKGVTRNDMNRNNTLIVATPRDHIAFSTADEIIYGPDGQPRFYFFYPVQALEFETETETVIP